MYYPNSNDWWLDPSAGRFDIRANGGAPLATVNSLGNLGIGTTSPGYRLEVNRDDGSADGDHAIFAFSKTSGAGNGLFGGYRAYGTLLRSGFIRSTNNLNLELGTAVAPFAVGIDQSGNVVIGAQALNYSARGKLDIQGGGIVIDNGRSINGTLSTSAQNRALVSTEFGTNDVLFGDRDYGSPANAWTSLKFMVGDISPKMIILNNGSVGIGLTNPTAKLHIGGAPGTDGIRFPDSTLQTTAATGGALWAPSGSNSYLTNASGKVGIGTTNPQKKLDVSGEINAGTVYQIAGSTVLAVNGTYNVFVGVNAGTSTTSGFQNTFVGASVGQSNTTGIRNTFVGSFVGSANTIGVNNVFMGFQAGLNNTTGGSNVFLGDGSGQNNTSGANNVFVGSTAGSNNTTGFLNSIVGQSAGANNTTGIQNAFLGSYSGQQNTTGGYNSFLGAYAGQYNTTGNSNAFVGNYAGNANIAGAGNAFLGASAGQNNTQGSNNTFLGANAGATNTTGSSNIALGYLAGGYLNTTGSSNTIVGVMAGYSNPAGQGGNVFLGFQAGYSETGSNKLYIANGGGTPLIYGDFAAGNVGVGTTNPVSKLNVLDGNIQISTNGTNRGIIFQDGTTQTTAFTGSSAGLSWSIVTADTPAQTNKGYITNSAGRLTVTLPSIANVGDVVSVAGLGAGGWNLAPPLGSSIQGRSGIASTATIPSDNPSDSLSVMCVVQNTGWLRMTASNSDISSGLCNASPVTYGAAGVYTFTMPANCTNVAVTMWGGGGGGGAGGVNYSASGGGGGGYTAGSMTLTSGQQVTVTVGAGGVGGAGYLTGGAAGGASSFGGLSAGGGGAGQSNNTPGLAGGSGGTGSTANGSAGAASGGNPNVAGGAAGGGGGAGGSGGVNGPNTPGNPGKAPGGGGGGGSYSSGSASGGAGADGSVQLNMSGLCAAGVRTYSAGGSYTFTMPSNCRTAVVSVWGGGGGGGSGGPNYGASGGGGGGFSQVGVTLTSGQQVSVTVGAGGAGGSGNMGSGTSGGSSSFGSYASATGGGGGQSNNTGNLPGGAGGTGSTAAGGSGGASTGNPSVTGGSAGGTGGGAGGAGGVLGANTPGNAGAFPGGGGGGSSYGSSTTGGAGAAGLVQIIYSL